jgi:diguanylate cyclase (GGDEF)-like protein/PAS domain S-box-containing protein
MALHAALSLSLLCMGILLARPERTFMRVILANTAGGDLMRRLLPTAVFLPLLIGSIWLMGQRLGLYDAALGMALMVISLMTSFVLLIWRNANQLTGLDFRRRQADSDLRASEHRFQTTLDNMIEGCQIIGYDWRYLYLNDTAVRHSRSTREALLGRTMMECYPGIERTALFATLQRCMKEQSPAQMVNEFVYPDGSRGWFDISIQPTPDGVFILSSDITRRRQAEQALLEREMKLSKLLDILPVGISILDAERQIMFTNPALKTMLEISEEGMQNGKYANRRYLRANGTPMPVEELASARALHEKRAIDDMETGVVKEDGSTVWTSVSAVPVNFSDWKLVLVTVDITSRKQAEREIVKLNAELEEKVRQRTRELAAANEQLHQLAILDELTGLYNRRGFHILAEEQILLAKRTGQKLVVFYGDLDGLKQINDLGGHAAGDQALVAAARALNLTFRASDIKARLGGDEFIILAIQCSESDTPSLLSRLQQELAKQNLTMSVGVLSFDTDENLGLPEIIVRADEAMYEVKSNRRGRQRG